MFDDEPLKWNSRCMHLKEIEEQEKIYLEKFIQKYGE
jgi:hypothetical protein